MSSKYHTFRTTARGGRLGPQLGFTNKCKVVNKVTKIISDKCDIKCKFKAIPIQAYYSPRRFQKVEAPYFETIGKGR